MKIPYEKLDESVRDLVFSLNYMGMQTVASCQGHLDYLHHSHPWVKFAKLDELYINDLISEYNENSSVLWSITERTSGKVLEPVTYNEKCFRCHHVSDETTEEQLKELQMSAKELAQYLFIKNYR